ncbi:extracellular solute-binding protein [Paenibacillus harenae]|uniref:extracellular solute-binding protein n=1 Tax=Paenibacillus harenae TaxID=306543 RepID=UPI00146B7963|nr:extracellular solute-binding protein [Paenibacillus harenae]
MKRIVRNVQSVGMAIVLLTGLLIGCGKTSEPPVNEPGNQTGEAAANKQGEKVESFRFLKAPISIELPKQDPYYDYVISKTGIDAKLETFPWNDYTQRLQTIIASGDIPELFRPAGTIDQTLITQGGALALDELLQEYAPNLWKKFPEEVWNKVRAASDDGKIYYIPKYDSDMPGRSIIMRKDWLENVGMEVPTTLEEYVEVLKAFRDKDPNQNGQKDELPTSGREGARWMDSMFGMYGIAMFEGYPEWQVVDGQMMYAGITPNMKEALAFLNMLYKEKLLDNETFLNKSDTWNAKIQSDKVGVWFHIPYQANTVIDNLKKVNPNAELVGAPLPKVDGYDGFISQKPLAFIDYMIPKSAAEQAPTILKYLDWWYSEEAETFMIYGLENDTWVKEDGKIKYLPEKDTQEKMTLRGNGTMSALSYYDTEFFVKTSELLHGEFTHVIQQMWDTARPFSQFIASDGMPNSVYNGFGDIGSHKIYQEYAAKFITGELPIEKFDEYVETWKKSGGDEVSKKVNEWYQKSNK